MLATVLVMAAGAIPAAPAEAAPGDESFSVRMVEQEVHGYGWEQGLEVTVAIDDPATDPDPDWSDTQLALPPQWDPTMGFVQFQPFVDGFVIEPGFEVTMSQLAGGTTQVKTHTVTSLVVVDVNEDTDVVSGTGDEDAPIHVSVWDDFGTWREATVTAGTWSADFSIAGPGGDQVNITRGTQGEAAESDADGDSTQWSWSIPAPAFSVETPGSVWSLNDGWVPGRTVTLTVDTDPDPTNGNLYQTTTEVQSWGPGPWNAGWSFGNLPYAIEPGHYVIADDGVDVTQVLHVVDLTITDINGNDITGTAPAGSMVDVHACDQVTCENVTATADGAGVWVANFSIGIVSGFGGAAEIRDVDGDSTHRGWQLQDPYFGVDVTHEEMWAVNWPVGETLTFQVFADETMADLLWTDTMVVFGTPWQNTEAGYRFWGEFDATGGQYFTVTDGVTPKDLVVSTVSITSVEPDTDRYTGTVDPAVTADVEAEVCAWARTADPNDDPNDGIEQCAQPDATTGAWSIDFAGVGDIIPGDHLGVRQRDDDGDETSYSWHVPPWIYVELAEQDDAGVDLYPDRVGLDQWIGPVDIYIGDVEVMSDVVTSGGYVQVDLDVEIGDTIRVVDAHDNKSLDIEELTIDNVTAWDDPDRPSTAFGTAVIPDNTRQVQVTASADYGWWTERWVPVIASQFEADFANPGNGWRESEIGYFGEGGAEDVYLGGEVRANLWDLDNDQVQAIWHTCNPRIIIVRNNDRIEAVCFPVGSELVVVLDDPATGIGTDWESDPVTVIRNPDKPWETLVVFELGEYTAPDAAEVTATATPDEGDPVVVTTEVIPFTIDLIDEDNDTITGTAPVGSEVLVNADGQWRYPIADAANTWVADFSEPGDQAGEENPVDLIPGSQGGATLIDENGSATTIAWRISNAQFQVDPSQGSIWANEFEPNGEITITIDPVDADPYVSGPYLLDEWGNFDSNYDGLSFVVPPDSVVTIGDGTTTKDHTVTGLVVTGVDADLDVVSGTAAPGSMVDVWEHQEGNTVSVVACDDGANPCDAGDAPGTWHADFSALVDLVAGHDGNSGQCDSDGDCTNAGWWAPSLPWVTGDAGNDQIWGGGPWALDDDITIMVDDPTTAADPDFTATTTMEPTEWNPNVYEFNLAVGADIGLMPGFKIVASDSSITKTLILTTLKITEVDSDNDLVRGLADDGVPVYIDGRSDQNGEWASRVVDPVEGSFEASFGVPGTGESEQVTIDVAPGSSGTAQQYDGDGDYTHAGWGVPGEGGPPQITMFEGPAEPLPFDVEALAEATFVDPGQDAGHAVELDWGDGTVSQPVPVYEDGVGSISDSHLYGGPGIYTLTLTITDEAGETTTDSFEYAVMYDPAGQKIKGTVKVVDETTSMHLSVNVKPDKKTGVPKGHVRFNPDGSGFADGFDATEITYLLIFGDWAIVTGTGTIDGAGEYGFLVSALDQSDEGGIDAFRVLIWNDVGVVFDSQPGDDSIATPTTVPTHGDIKIR